jgi:hypothetical protein
MQMRFEVANIDGTYEWEDSHLLIYLSGSGPISERPIASNDWVRTNFFAIPLIGVHAGYAVAAIRVAHYLRGEIESARRVTVGGYSLGGAAAEVLGAAIGFRGTKTVARNIGGPAPWRRGFHRWASHAADITWYSAGTDIIPFMPPWNRHAGIHVRIKTGVWNPIKNHIEGYEGVLNG